MTMNHVSALFLTTAIGIGGGIGSALAQATPPTTVPPAPAVSVPGQVDPGFGGGPVQPGPGPGPAPGLTATFDPATAIVPPRQLPIVDRYVKDLTVANAEAERANLTTISVTPDGRVELMPAKSADVEILMRALQRLQIGPQRMVSGQEGGSDSGRDEPQGRGVLAESVIGQDTRTQITATTTYPYRTHGRIAVGCTGTLIGPRHVLTAGHCVYNISNNQWYSNLDVSLGQNGATKPYGTTTWRRAVSVTGWTQSHLRDYDYAMIILNQDIGNSNGWLGYGWQNPMPTYNININGYPGDKPAGTMWHAFCQLQIIQTFRLYYACDTFGGMSGSAIYVLKPDQTRTIYGIHAYGVDSTNLNGGTRITESVFNKLKEWKQTY
jgi:V8-like Glu-specific endopeptidase